MNALKKAHNNRSSQSIDVNNLSGRTYFITFLNDYTSIAIGKFVKI